MDLSSITDLYIPLEKPQNSIFFPGPEPAWPWAEELINKVISKSSSKVDHSFTLYIENLGYRVQKMPTPDGIYLIVRKIKAELMTLSECGFSPVVKGYMLNSRLKSGGLILI